VLPRHRLYAVLCRRRRRVAAQHRHVQRLVARGLPEASQQPLEHSLVSGISKPIVPRDNDPHPSTAPRPTAVILRLSG